ncbi:transposase IS116/IS110/IS902 family protein [Caballeronia arationis]|nr:transposase IS116/IS110/IS902 family protein [Caballeronia arationis]
MSEQQRQDIWQAARPPKADGRALLDRLLLVAISRSPARRDVERIKDVNVATIKSSTRDFGAPGSVASLTQHAFAGSEIKSSTSPLRCGLRRTAPTVFKEYCRRRMPTASGCTRPSTVIRMRRRADVRTSGSPTTGLWQARGQPRPRSRDGRARERSLAGYRGVDGAARHWSARGCKVVAELGDLARFSGAPQLMAYPGLVPSEHFSSKRERRGGIIKTGNGHVRRVLIEAAWTYRSGQPRTVLCAGPQGCGRRIMNINTDAIDEVSPALLYLTLHDRYSA